MVYVGGDQQWLSRFFGEVRQVGVVRLPQTDAETANQGVPIHLVSDPVAPWPRLWVDMHRP